MTDVSSPSPSYPPRNGVHRFGVSFVGPTFEWAWTEPAGDGSLELEQRVDMFRAHPGLSFDEQLAYQRSLTMLQSTAVIEQRQMEADLTKIGETPDTDDATAAVEKIALEVQEHEKARWAMQIDQVMMLVAPADRDKLRPLLSQGNPADVRELKAWLVDRVITRTQREIEVTGAVDPTSQPSSAG